MKINLFLLILLLCNNELKSQTRSPERVDIYYENLDGSHSITSIQPQDYINYYEKSISISDIDTIRDLRTRMLLRLRPSKEDWKLFDTYIMIIDRGKQDTLFLSRQPHWPMRYNQIDIQPDTAFSKYIYRLIDFRDPCYILNSFPDE